MDVKIYHGGSASFSNLEATVKDGKVYKRGSTSFSNVTMTIKDGRIYKSSSTSFSNFQLYIKGRLTIEKFISECYAFKAIKTDI